MESLDPHRYADGDRLELLLFDIGGRQPFGINVLKVKEVIPAPRLTQVPQSNPAVRGVAHLRGETLSVVDLAMAMGRAPLDIGAGEGSVIITEFNRTIQGFLVRGVARIEHCEWKEVYPPPSGSGSRIYITGVTRVGDELVQIIDVERILGEVLVLETELDEVHEVARDLDPTVVEGRRVMVVDDSMMARNQTAQTLDTIGVDYLLARDGVEALAKLRGMRDSGEPQVDMVISDIEMPEMDGYALARAIRQDSELSDAYVLLHTSLNGAINAEKAHSAGADDILTKFVPGDLARAVLRGLGGGRESA